MLSRNSKYNDVVELFVNIRRLICGTAVSPLLCGSRTILQVFAVVDIGSPYVGKLNCMDIYTSYGD